MRKILVISFLLSFYFAHAGTGSANDAFLFCLAILAVMSFILAVLYSINFIRRIIKERKERKIAHLADQVNGENIS
ncbi:MAG: hypothetical protein A2X11_12915 [Bacteroidetes bacterium GWE2_42_24]|nr:MAG: hypothetical protein A2X11_12915 [Bacteroidetes bacterium GWE2_42_24]OFY28932.1 MAG: hypothetical protein A2X09_16965 [Bacteroidetes bacterium GWF2_43_11]